MKKFCSYIKRVSLSYKQDLLTYTQKDYLVNAKNQRQMATANSSGKFSWKISKSNSCAKFPRQSLNPLCGRDSHVQIKIKEVTIY